MSWRDTLQKMTHHQLKDVARLCAGATVLVAIALVLSGSTPLPESLKLALQKETSSQSAAVWWSQTPLNYYDGGWPVKHWWLYNNTVAGWCNTGYYTCPLPSYADAYVTSNPSQAITAKVVMPGYYFVFQQYQGPTYSGSILTVPAGTSVTLDWACQDWQAVNWSYGGECLRMEYWGCAEWSGGSAGTTYFYDYRPAVGTIIVNDVNVGSFGQTNAGSAIVNPTQTTTYSLYCPASSLYRSANGNVPPTMPTMSFTINVTAGPSAPTAAINARVGDNVSSNHALSILPGKTPNILARFTNDTSDPYVSTEILQYNSTPFDPPAQGSASGWTPVLYSGWTASTPVGGPFRFYARVSTSAFTAPATCTISNPQCDYVDITVTPAPQPTGTLKINEDPISTTIIYKQAVATIPIVGTYNASPDTLTQTAIVDDDGVSVKSDTTVPIATSLTYNLGVIALNKLTPGQYHFQAKEETFSYLLDNYSNSIVTLEVKCPINQHWDSVKKICVPSTPPPTPGSISDFHPTPTRVQKGKTTTLYWTVSDMASCSIDQGVGSVSAIDGTDSIPSPAINAATIFTLTCTDKEVPSVNSSKSTTVGLVPVFKEI